MKPPDAPTGSGTGATATRVIPIVPVSKATSGKSDGSPELISLYEKHRKIHPRSVSGRFANWRWVMVWVTQIVFYGLPWLSWNGRQAVLFELETRRFYLFELVFYPQDFVYLAGLLVICALALFLFTAVAGRVWCGYACPQTVYTELFMWIERRVEGERHHRMRRDAGRVNADYVWRKTLKHVIWGLLALWTGFTFVGYFSPIHTLGFDLLSLHMGPWEAFWVLFYSFATYGNAGWLREQVCKYMCPYARFQSAMFDKGTLIVGYDTARGEPRGARSRKQDPAALGLGSCVDCSLCVQVCPVGIDIRDGLQYECISCAACIDACDTVMKRVGYAPGLIRYATEATLADPGGSTSLRKTVLRPRVLVYSGLLGAICLAFVFSMWMRVPLKVDVIRDRAMLSRIIDDGAIENVYRLHLMNASENAQRLRIDVSGLPGLSLPEGEQLAPLLAPAQAVTVVVHVHLSANEVLAAGSHPIQFTIQEIDAHDIRVLEKSVFLVPR